MPNRDDAILKALERFENKIDSKIDKLDSRLDQVEKIQIKQEANLGEHMRRTDVAEKNLGLLWEAFKPVQKHVNYMEGALKALGIIGTVTAIAVGLFKIAEFFLK